MVDCTKSWNLMTPGQAVRCTYTSVSNGFSAIYDGISSVTIGDWLMYAMIAAWFPSVLAAFVLPFIFVARGIGKFINQDRYEETPEGRARWKLWSIYLFIAGVATSVISKSDPLMIGFAATQVACAAIQGIAGPSWWGRRYASDGRRLSE